MMQVLVNGMRWHGSSHSGKLEAITRHHLAESCLEIDVTVPVSHTVLLSHIGCLYVYLVVCALHSNC